MKFFSILVLALSLMFAPFLYAVDIGQPAPEIPGFQFSVINIDHPGIESACRDVQSFKQTVIFNKTNSANLGQTYLNRRYTISRQLIIYTNQEGDSYQTDRTVLFAAIG